MTERVKVERYLPTIISSSPSTTIFLLLKMTYELKEKSVAFLSSYLLFSCTYYEFDDKVCYIFSYNNRHAHFMDFLRPKRLIPIV